MMHLLVGGFRPRYTSVEHENLDNSVFEDAAAPRAMFDEDQEQNEPPPMHRSKSSLGAQSRGTILHYCTLSFSLYLGLIQQTPFALCLATTTTPPPAFLL